MSTASSLLFGGIEGGGTKFVCAVGTEAGEILADVRFPTASPEETLAQTLDFFKGQIQTLGPLVSIGVAMFGPLDPRPASATFGRVLATPKPGWSNADVVGPLRAAFDLPIAFDTDVNGAALGEWRWGAARGLDDAIYLTVGTGIGGGALVNGRLVHGLLHPEMGHIPLPQDKVADPFESCCPFHCDCFEGLASGPAMEKRWGQKAETLPPDHPAWVLEAHYIALALRSFICTLSPQRIIIGGGVAQQPQLMPLIRKKTVAALNGYVRSPAILEEIDTYIVPPALGGQAGVLGAIALAEQASSYDFPNLL
jgi:fructokinase